jgi:energy-coupling factor transporter ATP-binding protein EcfA2
MAVPAILVVTGASGVGKTTLVHALQARAIAGVRCYHFDSVGIPSTAQMMAVYGSPQAWQVATTHQWIARLAANPDQCTIAVLEGQVRPSLIYQAFAEQDVRHGRVLLLECESGLRDTRLRELRRQPEAANASMTAWAAYLRGQADALGLPVLDTGACSLEQATEQLATQIRALLVGTA